MLCKQKQKMSNLRISQNHKGLTLVEVIAMIAVLSVVMAVVAGFMISGAKMSAKVSDNAGASIREHTAVEFINKTLNKAALASIGIMAIVLFVPGLNTLFGLSYLAWHKYLIGLALALVPTVIMEISKAIPDGAFKR